MKRENRYNKHQDMRSDKKKRKRDNHAAFKESIAKAKKSKNKPSAPEIAAQAGKVGSSPLSPPLATSAATPISPRTDFKSILKKRAEARRARADRWRTGRQDRGTMRLYGYALCPFAEQARLALAISHQAFTFEEPSLPYWLVPDKDEQENDGKSEMEATSDKLENEVAESAMPSLEDNLAAYNLDSVKLMHGDVILKSTWEIFLYVDCLLQAGSKVLKNRHTGAHRGAPPFFPPRPADRTQCFKLLRSLHGSLICAYCDLVESLKNKQDYIRVAPTALEKINKASSELESLLSQSETQFAFGLKRPGMLEAWCGPIFRRLCLLGLWKPSDLIGSWLRSSDIIPGGTNSKDEESELFEISTLRKFHVSGGGKERPLWVKDSVSSPDLVWQ